MSNIIGNSSSTNSTEPFGIYKSWRSIGYTKVQSSHACEFQRKLKETTDHLNQREELMLSNVISNNFVLHNHRQYGFITEHKLNREFNVVFMRQTLFIKVRTDCSVGPSYLQHHNNMNEMWQEFADALRNCGFDGIELFEVSKVQLSRSVMDLLMPVLATKNITFLSLNRTDFGFDGYLALSTFLDEKTPVLRLELVGNKLDCVAVGIKFFESVGAHPSLQSMKLEDCGIGNDIGLLSALADTFENLSSLDLRGNEIGTKGVEQICNSLSKNPSLERLNLRDNDINDTDVILVAVSLARNTNLRWLCLQDTDITDEGIMRLINSLLNTSSREALELSNHTCQIHVGRDKTNLSLGCINWINRYTVIEKNLKEKVAVFREFKRNLQSKRHLPNPGDIRDHVNDQFLIINERNAQFKKAGKDALLYLTGASPTRQDSPRVKFSYNHLRSIGYDRKYCKAILTFQEELQQLIESLRNGKDPTTAESCSFVWAKGGTCLKIKLHFFVPLNGQCQLLYRDELLECWKDLSDAIANCPCKQISLLEINNIQIKTAILEVLLPAVAKKDISVLSFKTNNLGCDEISALATFVSSNNTLESLEISGSILSNPKQAKLLSTAICESSLKRLKVEKCALGQNVSVLIEVAKAMNHLLYIYLSGNDIGSNGATVISDVLAKNPPITELYLNDNELMDHDLVPIAQALRSNSNLRSLYIRENLLTSVGDDILTKAMWDGTNFITACTSNHTCRIFETKRSALNHSKSGRDNLYGKIVGTIMLSNSFRKGTFEGVPVALMPHALSLTFKSMKACYTRKTAKTLTLNCLFDFLSSWAMPELLTFGADASPCVKRNDKNQFIDKTAKKKRRAQKRFNPASFVPEHNAHETFN